jgi:hypothetical protein
MDVTGEGARGDDAPVRRELALGQIRPDEKLITETIALEGMHETRAAVFLVITDQRLLWIRDEGPMATMDLWFKDIIASYCHEPTRKMILEAGAARNGDPSRGDTPLVAFELAPLGTPEEIIRVVQSLLPEEAQETLPDLGTGVRARAVIFRKHVPLKEDGGGVTFKLYRDPFARREQWLWDYDDGVDPAAVESLVEAELAKLQAQIAQERGETSDRSAHESDGK